MGKSIPTRSHLRRDLSRHRGITERRRGNSTNYIMDGGSNNDHYSNGSNPMPNPDALQEFSVQTNSSAEYGRNTGAIVNAVTRSGTNRFSGLGFGYLRDSSMNANNFFTPGIDDGLNRSSSAARSAARSAEQDVLLRFLPGHDEEQRPADLTSLVPTAAQRLGDFTDASHAWLRDPLTGQPFPGNIIPANRIIRPPR